MKRLVILMTAVILLVGCKSVPEQMTFPDLSMVRPERPVLLETADHESCLTNMIRLMGYSEELEIYSDALESWHDTVSEILNGNRK